MRRSFYYTDMEAIEDGFKYHGLTYNRKGIIRLLIQYFGSSGGDDLTAAEYFTYDHHINEYQKLIIFPINDEVTPLELNDILEMTRAHYPDHECSVVYNHPQL